MGDDVTEEVESAGCVLGWSTFGTTSICVQCGDECDCYVCLPDAERR